MPAVFSLPCTCFIYQLLQILTLGAYYGSLGPLHRFSSGIFLRQFKNYNWKKIWNRPKKRSFPTCRAAVKWHFIVPRQAAEKPPVRPSVRAVRVVGSDGKFGLPRINISTWLPRYIIYNFFDEFFFDVWIIPTIHLNYMNLFYNV